MFPGAVSGGSAAVAAPGEVTEDVIRRFGVYNMSTHRDPRRRCYYSDYLRLESLLAQQVRESERSDTLVGQLDRWLARTPFVELSGYAFSNAYREAVTRSLAADSELIRASEGMSESQREAETRAINAALA